MLDSEIKLEEVIFLRIAYEYTKIYKSERSQEYLDYLDKIALSFEDYQAIFNFLLKSEQQADHFNHD